jgi:hypothetical protein
MPAVGAAIAAIATSVTAAFAAGGFFTTFFGRLLIVVALSALQRAMRPDAPREPGIKTKVTQTGGVNPQAFPLLRYATAGTLVAPPMSHGTVGNTPNAYLTYVILLSDIPGATLSQVMINSQYVALAASDDGVLGRPVLGQYFGHAWVRYYNGTQTVADPMLRSRYGGYPERPWPADMIGRGSCYAIVTFLYNREIFPGLPRCRFELNGIPLYDPRKDSTVGGSGAHRWANKATWEPTVNPVVAAYNVMRGISLPDNSIWGGNLPAEDLPLATWFAAMNECDLLVSNGASGTEPQFRAGLEVSVDEEPADVLAELMKACSGQLAEIGGLWKIRVGPPGLPVMSFTDDDIVITKPQDFLPFPSFVSSYNGANASYPDPASTWQSRDAQPYFNATYEAADQGQRLVADLNLVAVPYAAQVRRLMYAYVEEERRFRRHDLTLPCDFARLEPLDAIAWTSAENGYASKLFEVAGVTEDLQTGLLALILKERDPADYSYPGLPAPEEISNLPVVPAVQTVPSFTVSGASIPDATNTARRPALVLTWEPNLPDVTGIMWEVRLQATGVVIGRGSTQDVASGTLILSEGVLAGTVYEVRTQPVVDRPHDWTAWLPATTPNLLISRPDIGFGAVSEQLQTVVLEPFSGPALTINTIVATLAIGPNGQGEGWERRVHFDARNSPGAAWTLVLEARSAQLGNPFSAWDVQQTWTFPTNAPWGVFGGGGQLSEHWDAFEYRLRVSAAPSPLTGPCLRDIYLTAVKITK